MGKVYTKKQMSKKSINMFFHNLNLVPMPKNLSYKNLNKMRAQLTKLPYSKIT